MYILYVRVLFKICIKTVSVLMTTANDENREFNLYFMLSPVRIKYVNFGSYI